VGIFETLNPLAFDDSILLTFPVFNGMEAKDHRSNRNEETDDETKHLSKLIGIHCRTSTQADAILGTYLKAQAAPSPQIRNPKEFAPVANPIYENASEKH
jgi:hypothetical protein